MNDRELAEAVAYNRSHNYSRTTWVHIQIAVGAPLDGIPGPITTEAVYQFQACYSIEPVDGKVGPITLDFIGAGPNEGANILNLPHVVWRFPYLAFGVDVSDYQKEVRWDQLFFAGVRFAFVKVTEGRTWRSKYASINWPRAIDAGIPVAGYHLARLMYRGAESDVEGALDNFFGMLEKLGGVGDFAPFGPDYSLPHMLDLELQQVREHAAKFGAAKTLGWIERWVDGYRRRNGTDPGLYLSRWTVNILGNHCGDLPSLVTWWPDYRSEIGGEPDRGRPGLWPSWTFRQYTSNGVVAGVDGVCDLNYMMKKDFSV